MVFQGLLANLLQLWELAWRVINYGTAATGFVGMAYIQCSHGGAELSATSCGGTGL